MKTLVRTLGLVAATSMLVVGMSIAPVSPVHAAANTKMAKSHKMGKMHKGHKGAKGHKGSKMKGKMGGTKMGSEKMKGGAK